MLYQLQGVRGKRLDTGPGWSGAYVLGSTSARGLAPLDWRKLLVDVTTDVATSVHMTSVGIQAAEHNKWTKRRNGEAEPHLTQEAAAKAYDDTAERLGFVRGSDHNWHRALTVR